MKLSECVKQPVPLSGECDIDIKKVVRCFGFSTISKYGDSYRLINRRAGLKITIREESARELIELMKLVEVDSGIFANASTFMTKNRAKKFYSPR